VDTDAATEAGPPPGTLTAPSPAWGVAEADKPDQEAPDADAADAVAATTVTIASTPEAVSTVGPVTETGPDEDTEPVAEAPVSEAASPRRQGSRLVPAAVIGVVLAVAGSVLLAVVAQRMAHHNAVDDARKAAIAAARTETAATLSYDYRHLAADFAAAERGLTPKFRTSYARTAASSVVPLARQTHAVSTATVAAAGVVSAGADSAKILVYADQTVQNNLLKTTSRLDQSVIEVSMVKRGGRWLIDNLQPF
jgi:hypothetical protein